MKIHSPRVNRIMARCAVAVCRTLFRTLRMHFLEADPSVNPYHGDGPAVIYSVWHDVAAYPIFAGRHKRTVALVSKHQDGSLLASGLSMCDIGLVRGSSSRAGASAMREMIDLPDDRNIVMTPDGPRGPRRRTKAGMVFLASHTGRPIVPCGFAATRDWKIPGSWTNLSIPKPFSTVYLITGEPIPVPRGASREEMAAIEEHVQREMDRLTEAAEQLAHPNVATTAYQESRPQAPLARPSRTKIDRADLDRSAAA
ncbi:MAG: lysophospholipid acyltransferase family protein [Planctomycetia bacterium]|nr:lysophospholipid acyltransferase family protein [Planctomycetia bacterium]